jgi:hypothetical protein
LDISVIAFALAEHMIVEKPGADCVIKEMLRNEFTKESIG